MKFYLLSLLILLSGCASMSTDRMDVRLGSVRYHSDADVLLSEVVQAVTPASMPEEEARALLLPFAVRQDIGVRKEVGREMGDIFYRTWLAEKVFSVMEYDTAKPWPGLADALAQARSKGANILVTGNISNFLEGGGTGRTSISVTVQIYWVPSSTLIWSAAQAGAMESAPDRDYVVVQTTRRLPEFPSFTVMQTLSSSLAKAFTAHFKQ